MLKPLQDVGRYWKYVNRGPRCMVVEIMSGTKLLQSEGLFCLEFYVELCRRLLPAVAQGHWEVAVTTALVALAATVSWASFGL